MELPDIPPPEVSKRYKPRKPTGKPKKPPVTRRPAPPKLSDLPGPEMPEPPSFVPATAADIPDLFRLQNRTERISDDILEVAGELLRREREALSLYVPLPAQEAFHKSPTKTRLLRGSTRGGKTLPAAVEFARMALGADPHNKYPKKGVAYIIGADYSHHGTVIYPKLFKPGAFRVVRDLDTDLWRAYQPWTKEDRGREAEAVEAEPLIPERFIDEIAWEDKRKEIPSVVRLTTGWEIYFWSGKAHPPKGQAIDGAWMDEEIGREGWHAELVSRSLDRDGKIWWSAAPQTGTQILYDLSEEANATIDDPERVVDEFIIRLADNPHISDAAKGVMARSLSEAERAIRIDGEFALAGIKVYPEWANKIHGIDYFQIPDDWTRYAVVDPGHQICAVLFGAVPPPYDDMRKEGDLFLYDELYIPRCNAQMFGERMRVKAVGQRFRDFLIDKHGSRAHEAGSGKTIEEQYGAELKTHNVRSKVSGHGFTWGSDDIKAGISTVRSYLRVNQRGRPKLRVLTVTMGGVKKPTLPNFEWEVNRYHFLKKGELITENTDERGRVHLMACLRYLCAYEPRWYPPEEQAEPPSAAYLAVQAKRKAAGLQKVGLVFGPGRESFG